MNSRHFFVVAAASVMLAACGGGNDDDRPGGGGGGGQTPQQQGQTVSFSASLVTFQEYDDAGRLQQGPLNRSFSPSDDFAVWAVAGGNRPTGSGAAYSYSGGQLKPAASALTTDGQQQTAYYAVTPRLSTSAGTVSFTADSDQSTESRFWANDLCTATSAATAAASVSLSFAHRLCCVCVNFVGDVEGIISQVSLSGVRLGARLSFGDTADQATGSASTVKTLQQGQNYYALVPPQAFEAGSVLATVTLDGEDYDVTFDEAVSYEGGMMHYLDVVYDGGGDRPVFVGFTGDINPWQK